MQMANKEHVSQRGSGEHKEGRLCMCVKSPLGGSRNKTVFEIVKNDDILIYIAFLL